MYIYIIYACLASYLNVIGSIMSSSKKVHLLKFKKLCFEAHIHIITNWSWCLFSESIHRILDHSWQLILKNENSGLACESEQSMEAAHKKTKMYMGTSGKEVLSQGELRGHHQARLGKGGPRRRLPRQIGPLHNAVLMVTGHRAVH